MICNSPTPALSCCEEFSSAISGYTADPLYDGAALARAANAVVVTANYRLDILGYMHMPQMQAGAPATGTQ